MEILKDQGEFEILTPTKFLAQQLKVIESAGRTCYQSETGEITEESADKFIRMVLRRGHASVIEHSVLTIRFSNCSRGFTHELVRHRLCAFSQESTRFVDYAKPGDEDIDLDNISISFVTPPHRDENEEIELEDGSVCTPADMFKMAEKNYSALRKSGWEPEDARQLLPIGLKSQIVVSANFREWRHIMKMRTDKHAHWEIRKVMTELLFKLKSILPSIFEDFKLSGQCKKGIPHYKKSGEYKD